MHLGGNFWPENLKLEESDKINLIRPFTIDEIRGVIMGMKDNSAPGPNGFSVSFFKKCWVSVSRELRV
jgi:hypothetical protein